MTSVFPGALPTHTDYTGTEKLGTVTGLIHHSKHNKDDQDIEALAAKVGISESSPVDAPVADSVLISPTNLKSKWAKITSAMITDGTIVAADMGLIWASYTPQIWQNGQRTITVTEARQLTQGKLVHALGTAVLTNAGTINNSIQIVIPTPPALGALAATTKVVGAIGVYRTGGAMRHGAAIMATNNVLTAWADGKNDVMGTASDPFALAIGDTVSWDVIYELA